jgi:ribose 5-phosphate isomerase B
MKVAIAADHAGSPLLPPLLEEVRRLGHEGIDLGTHDTVTPDDYPDRAADLAAALLAGRAERGVLVCGSGVGASVAANKVRGIRAALCHDTYSAHQGVEHDQMNVLCLGARVIGPELALELLRAFLAATISHEPRHLRRVGKIAAMESRFQGS